MVKLNNMLRIVFISFPFLLSACASYEEYNVPDQDIPEGPGLFSGEEGQFEIDLD